MNKEQANTKIQTILAAVSSQSADEILLETLNHHPHIAIYGAGNLGKQMYDILRQAEVQVCCFLDRAAQPGQTTLGIPVYCAEDAVDIIEQKRAVVILALMVSQTAKSAIASALHKLGYTNVMDAYSLLAAALPFANNETSRQQFARSAQRIGMALGLLADDHSRDIFCSNLSAHATYNYDNTLISEGMTQYFDVQVPFAKGYRHFVDCGAFTGDSLEELVKRHELHSYVAFEPDAGTFTKLTATVDGLRDKLCNAYLFPCATGSKPDFASFDAQGGGSSAIREGGDLTVQVVRLDDVLKGQDITMLKMDIEGAETDTLYGARHIITGQQPDLAICVYHRVADIWEIPLLLHEWVPGYRFYLRCHYNATMETVLYATVS